MRSRRILILSNQPLFAQAVRNLVESNGQMKVIGVRSYDSHTIGQLKALRPQIIVLGDEKDLPSTILPTLLDAMPGIRIIRLTLDGNVIRVYDCHHMIAHQANDLVDAFDFLFDRSKSTLISSSPPLSSVPRPRKIIVASHAAQKKKKLKTARLGNKTQRTRTSRKEEMAQHK